MTPTTRHFDPRRHSPVNEYTVPLVIWDVLEDVWGKSRVDFTQAHPTDDNLSGPRIVWGIYRKIPGKDGLETLKPRARSAVRDPSNPDAYVDTWGQWYTVIYQFDIFTTDHNTANDIVLKFEELMFQITSTLKSAGVVEWLFDEQVLDDVTSGRYVQHLCKRTLRYRCVIDKRYTRQLPSFKRIWIKPISGDILVTNEAVVRTASIGRDYDTLANTWVSSIVAVDTIPLATEASSGSFIENIDFITDINLSTGESRLVWLSGAKRPQASSTYYVTYTHSREERYVEVGDPPRKPTS